jgi:hypothetical protein
LIDDQVRVCRRYAELQGFTVAAVYTDPAMSGASTLRPGYQKLLEDARNGAPVVAAPDPDVTCVPSELDVRVIACSDGRALRFDGKTLREILEQPRVHLLAERQLRSGDRTGEEPCRAARRRSAPRSF